MTLRIIQTLKEQTPMPAPQQPKSCGLLTESQRQIMADIYKSAGLRPIHVTKSTMNKYRKSFE